MQIKKLYRVYNMLSPLRFDLAAKLIYAKHKLVNPQTQWYVDLYLNHILTFNGGWEYPGTKVTENEFLKCFDNMLLNFDAKKMSPIEVGTNGIIVNGSHRLITSYILKKPIVTKKVNIKGAIYPYAFFADRKRHGIHPQTPKTNKVLSSMKPEWLDEMALEFCRIVETIRIIIMFPQAIGKEKECTNIINKYGTIVYALKFNTNFTALDNLIKELYRGEEWIGGFWADRSLSKTRLCWNDNNPYVTVYLFSPSNTNIQDMKNDIRDLYKNRHSVHINDTHEETLRIAGTVFNRNSRDYLTHISPLTSYNKELFKTYYDLLTDKQCMCIDSSFVLALLGLREAADLDFLHFDNVDIHAKNVNSHNEWSHHYDEHRDDIIFNPLKHFYFAGIKFASLDVVRRMKINRNESKDVKDLALISTILKN